MQKSLTVATEVQKVLFEGPLLSHISSGFWKTARPADHADYWKNVTVSVGTDLGVKGFTAPRNYNFVNPEFFAKNEQQLLTAAQTVQADITLKQLKKQLISLNQILGSRLKEVGGQISKLHRGRKASSQQPTTDSTPSVRKAAVKFVEQELVEA
jgi:hypothetical protein